jgi:hypothetical protein
MKFFFRIVAFATFCQGKNLTTVKILLCEKFSVKKLAFTKQQTSFRIRLLYNKHGEPLERAQKK